MSTGGLSPLCAVASVVRSVPHLSSVATYKEGRLCAVWRLLVRKLIIYLRATQESAVCKPAPTALPIIGSTSDCLCFLSALYLCSHQPSC